MTDRYIGEIQIFAFNFNPRGWMPCDGRLLQIAQYSAVFSLLGVQYGGNGQTTFGLPNLLGRVPIGQGNGASLTPRTIGELSGAEATTLAVSNMPTHTHPFLAANVVGNATSPVGAFLGKASDDAFQFVSATPGAAMSTLAIGAMGGSAPFTNMPPYLVINYSICVEGIFPSRN